MGLKTNRGKTTARPHVPVQPLRTPAAQGKPGVTRPVQGQPQAKPQELQKNKPETSSTVQAPHVATFTPPAPIPAAMIDEQDVVRESRAKAREIVVEAKAEALAIRSKAEQETRELISST